MDANTTLRGGRYVVLGSLGEGAQGRTFDGVDKREGQPVAVKRFDVRGAASWKDVDLAEREARVLQSLSHPRLPRYVDRFEEDGALYLVMEKIEGESLASMRRRGAAFDETQVRRLLRDAGEVLDYLHGRAPPVIHRDLKPGNILLRPDGSFAFVDFGAVRDKLRPEGGSTVVGTFGYMAPEQFQGRALPASDVYAVGATAITMLTGEDPEHLPHKGLAIDVRAALRGRASEAMVGVLQRMLDPDPDRRASKIGPLLLERGGAPRGRGGSRAREVHDEHVQQVSGRPSRHEAHRQAQRARHQARRAQRQARRLARRRHGMPFPLSLLLMIPFLAAMIAVSIATQVVVPIVLTVISLFVARRALGTAVEAVRHAGHRAVDAMERARSGVRGGPAADEVRVRFEGEEQKGGPRVRVEGEPSHDGEHDGEEEDEEHDAGSRAGR